MQDVDRIAHVQALAEPSWRRRVRVQSQSLGDVPCSQHLGRVVWHLGRRRDDENDPTVRTPEPKLAIRLSVDLISLFVNGAMVPATE
jgi:hypothetical protein